MDRNFIFCLYPVISSSLLINLFIYSLIDSKYIILFPELLWSSKYSFCNWNILFSIFLFCFNIKFLVDNSSFSWFICSFRESIIFCCTINFWFFSFNLYIDLFIWFWSFWMTIFFSFNKLLNLKLNSSLLLEIFSIL